MLGNSKRILIITVVVGLILVAVVLYFIFRGQPEETSPLPSPIATLSSSPAITPTDTPATSIPTPEQQTSVMYFYSDSCSWCQKQSPIIAQLEQEGYSFTMMDVVANSNYWQDYNVSGTPTLVSSTGMRLEGYQEYNSLKTWIDQL